MVSSKNKNRKEDILQALAAMLESNEGTQRITTAKLAATVGVSEAALYRHFPSKTKMFESLIVYIEDILLSRINVIMQDEPNTFARLQLILALILGFSEKNPGLTRIMTGHALMFEQEQLQDRISQLFERIETQIKQVIRERKIREGIAFITDERILASQLLAFCEGMMARYSRSGFKYLPTTNFETRWALLAKQLV
ncbi:nucleoid occlusion factor SlmA [Gilliamella apicola]|uniref:Nucleoid occlusion factor SlmA n=3 Tax=Gilliamella TaxID=1193503 RepID=A0A556RHP6_9GAMM|nr:nucleoid occlusion factor SlmA [Gilliamella sp. W8126]MBI0038805.1 nucleoid occlusion factor SlmA [Gilliamella sp. B14384G10]MBI0041074.1 nucleoid occlusion factor SlmA [Gilliamella sp. B14384G7]MBI0052797.1 nucleoid occlusion factor SlmA [Gilliamella sp. B14384G13]MBI0055092.1 nucleoid occlusion factor SlmA [Gilliamella sp. B14384H2]PXY88376.1 nucleoid occlusion factor SlmA [Gilliamella apis]TSJ88407.1 nucleoid occlusion factor SlmA [Gilliamella apicola]